MASLRHCAPGVLSGQGAAPWHAGIAGCAPAGFDLSVALPRVIRAVTTDGSDRHVCRNLIEQIGQHFGIGDVLKRHQCHAYLAALRIQSQMHLAPGAPLRIPLGILLAIRLMPPYVLEACQLKASEWEESHVKRPVSEVVAVLIVLIWLAAW